MWYRADWLAQLAEPGTRRRGERLYEQLDGLQRLHREARRELLVESHKHAAVRLLRQIPAIGPQLPSATVAKSS